MSKNLITKLEDTIEILEKGESLNNVAIYALLVEVLEELTITRDLFGQHI